MSKIAPEHLPHLRSIPDYAHQSGALRRFAGSPAFALFWEPGCGKTKTILDDAARQCRLGDVDCLLAIAPNGVHRNWVTDEAPKFMDNMRVSGLVWDSSRSKTKWQIDAESVALNRHELILVAMTYDALATVAGYSFALRLLGSRKCMMVADESTKIKTPSAQRTKAMMRLGKFAPYRRILTGTPVANGPFDLYSQIRWLIPDFWKRNGLGSFMAFKQEFGVFRRQTFGARAFDQLVEYKNLDKLAKLLEPVSSRVTKAEALDLPDKIYTTRSFEMTAKQRKIYDQLRDNLIAEVDGGLMSAPLAIVKLTRLAQITSGMVALDDCPDIVAVDRTNPRLELLQSILEDLPHQAIIWARFTKDIDWICQMLGSGAARYDGAVAQKDRSGEIDRFRSGAAKFFVANPAAISMGITLTEAKTVIYYNNSFNLTDRLQSEDRAHRIGQSEKVQIIDLCASGTVDEKIADALRRKVAISDMITGDKLREWL